MYAIHVDGLGYFCGWDNGSFGYEPEYQSFPFSFKHKDEAYDKAKALFNTTGKKTRVIFLKEEEEYIYEKPKTTLKDLKKGDKFQFLTNENEVFMVISDTEFVGMYTTNYIPKQFNRVGLFFPIENHKTFAIERVN